MTTAYEKGDKIVVELDVIEATTLKKDKSMLIANSEILGKLEDFQPVEEKIKFTPEMKKEFDKLKSLGCVTPYAFMSAMHTCDCPALKKWINADSVDKCVINQFEFSRAILDESLIVVIEPEKHSITFGNGLDKQYLFKGVSENSKWIWTLSIANFNSKFTLDEVKQAEKYLGIQGLQSKWHEAAKEEQG